MEQTTSAERARARLLELAGNYAGVGVSFQADRYLGLVAVPEDPPNVRDSMRNMSGCALVARGLWRLAGVEHPALTSPYRIGRAVSDLVDVAASARGVELVRGDRPFPGLETGDVVLVGGSAKEDGGPEHVWLALEPSEPLGEGELGNVWGLDGGQRDARGGQLVERRRHRVYYTTRWVEQAFSPRVGALRRVRLVLRFGAVWGRWGRAELPPAA